jgi:hypothetical protein
VIVALAVARTVSGAAEGPAGRRRGPHGKEQGHGAGSMKTHCGKARRPLAIEGDAGMLVGFFDWLAHQSRDR